MMVFLWLMCWTQGEIVLEKTDVFNPLTQKTAARRDDGAFFVFDRFDHDIWLFEAHGAGKRKVARKGPGPGELERTNRLLLFEQALYVFSADHIQVFDLEGVYRERIRLPPGLRVEKTSTGWVGLKQRMGRKHQELAFYNHDLTQSQLVVTWEEERARLRPIKQGEPRKVFVFPELGNFIVSRDGERLYYRLPYRGAIEIFSTREKAWVSRIDLEKRYPFDEARGQAVVDKLKARLPDSKVKGVFPEFFPYTNGFHWDPRGFFMVAQWQGKQLALLRFDAAGNPLPNAGLTVEQFERVIAAEEGYFYVSFQDPEREDMGIRRVREDQVLAFFEQFPMEE